MPEAPIEKLEKICSGDLPDTFEVIMKDDSIKIPAKIDASAYIKNAIDNLKAALDILKRAGS